MEDFPTSGDRCPFFESIEHANETKDLRKRLEEVLGGLSDEQFNKISPTASANFEQAVIEWLEATPPTPPHSELHSDTTDSLERPRTPSISTRAEPAGGAEEQPRIEIVSPVALEEDFEDRYLGSFSCDLFCTRSGNHGVQYGEFLEPVRIQPNVPAKNPSRKDREDYIIRFYKNGRDFARVCENRARFMAVLMDTGVCRFKVQCIYAEEPMHIGDSILAQVDVHLRWSAFYRDFMDFRSTTVPRSQLEPTYRDEGRETGSERVMRLRQIAINELFAALNLIEPKLPDMNKTIDDINAQTQQPAADELTSDQMDQLYQSTSRSELPEAMPTDSLSVALWPFQKRGLSWMLEQESQEHAVQSDQLHPMWSEFSWPDQCKKPFYANLSSGELSLEKPTLELKGSGGILADEMGLGKTISTLSLIHTGNQRLTLVVTPMSLLAQWQSETKKASKPNTCDVLVYYGSEIAELHSFLNTNQNRKKVLLTSYGVLVSEHRALQEFRLKQDQKFVHSLWKGKNSKLIGLFGVEFGRMVLDEAHTIKNRSTKTAKACYDIRAKKKWCLTGTPVVNRLEDLYSLIRFLEIDPWQNFSFWRAFVTKPFETREGRERAMNTVQTIVTPLILRRTKQMTENGKPLVELPEKTVEIRRIAFSPAERELYSFVYHHIKSSIEGQMYAGTASSAYTSILALVTRLRQTCDHPRLAELSRPVSGEKRGSDEELQGLLKPFVAAISNEADLLDTYSSDVIRNAVQGEDVECPICAAEPIPKGQRAFTECFHTACLSCLLCHIEYHERRGQRPECHICRKPISGERLLVLRETPQGKSLRRYRASAQSTKVRALLEALRSSPGNGKNVVFSQFTSFLDILQRELIEDGHKTVRFDGSMSQQQRSAVLEEFRTSAEPLVMLISLKAGGVGLNLVSARQAFMMDPWWSWAVESQAIDRIHRVGQTDSVHIVRFIVEGTIEERMLHIQERKRALSSVVTEEERKAEALENIRLLFDLD